ncbi:unnamed protein product, partial [Rotaria magnacalcarata]
VILDRSLMVDQDLSETVHRRRN